jgi:hydroxylamine reductase (hybrid-cluster protein)
MTTRTLTQSETVERTMSYMKRSKSALADLARTMGLDATGSKAELVARIVANTLVAEVEPKHFDLSGLVIGVGR